MKVLQLMNCEMPLETWKKKQLHRNWNFLANAFLKQIEVENTTDHNKNMCDDEIYQPNQRKYQHDDETESLLEYSSDEYESAVENLD